MKNQKEQIFDDIFFSRFLIKPAKNLLFKSTVITLAFLFVFQPLAIAFAATTYTYDYNNRLTSAINKDTGAVTTYAYDPSGQRIKMTVVDSTKGINTTTYYPSKYYEEIHDNNNPSAPPKIVKHIFANGVEIQTVFGTGNNAKTYTTLTDNLGNVTGLVDSTGKLVESTDYYPFGAIRTNTKIDSDVPSNPNKFLGQKYDEETGLNYLNARYYNSAIGRFTSQDPVALAVGDEQKLKQLTGKSQQEILADPQQLNSYSYARNNPITLSDPTGKCAWDACAVEGLAITSPMWMPLVAAGAATIASIIGYHGYSSYEQQRLRQVSTPLPTIESLAGQPPNGSGLSPTPDKNTPKWIKVGLATLGVIGTYFTKMEDINSAVNNTKDYLVNLIGSNNNRQTQNNQISDIISTQIGSQRSFNQPIYNSPQSYSYSGSQISVLQQQISILRQIVSLQSQTNQLKSILNKEK